VNHAMKMGRTFSLAFLALVLTGPAVSRGDTACRPGDPAPGQSAGTGAVKGYVRDVATGTPVGAVRITLVYVKNETVKFDLQTDKKGYFYIGGLAPGYYTFFLEKTGFLPISQAVRVPLGEIAQSDFVLQTLATAQTSGSPAAGVKAIAAFKNGKWDEAVQAFSEALASDATNPTLFFYRGASEENRGRMDEALADYQKAIVLKPDFVLAYARSAKIHARQKSYEKALSCYQKALELGDPDITTLYNSAIILMNLGKNLEATDALDSLLKRDPDYADAYYYLGILSIGRGETEKAKNLLQKFLQLDPANPNASVAKQILASLG
jgi:Flp pilus assembly protein TadD